MALDPDNAGRMLTTSPLTGEKCNLLGALLCSKEDLVKTVKLRRWWQKHYGHLLNHLQ
ncbi:MAG: hypothetical protein AB1523_16865 [Bacillota bacterium]